MRLVDADKARECFGGDGVTGAVMKRRRADNGQSGEVEQDRTKEIDEQKEYMQTDEYIAEVARDKLGLVKGNEIVFEEEK